MPWERIPQHVHLLMLATTCVHYGYVIAGYIICLVHTSGLSRIILSLSLSLSLVSLPSSLPFPPQSVLRTTFAHGQ